MPRARSTPAASSAMPLHGEPVGRHRRAPGAPVVERRHAVAVGERLELERPGFDRIAEAGEQQHVGTSAPLLEPQFGIADGHEAGAAP